MTPRFQYKPLQRPELLRVLRVDSLAATGDLIPTCTLQQLDRHDPESSWIALSYRWGDENDLVPLMIKEMDEKASVLVEELSDDTSQHFPALVPRSAWEMITTLYRSGHIHNEWVWIDYLCINQQDTEEKNAQVKLMGQVYELSSLTLVFLGVEVSTTKLALEFWDRLTGIFCQLDFRQGEDGFLISTDTLFKMTGTSPDSSEWTALHEMLTRPWFGRLWVMQEAVLPQQLKFIWGSHSLPWAALAHFVGWDHRSNLSAIIGRSKRLWTSISVLKRIKHLRNNRDGRHQGWRCGLSYALYQCDVTTSFDPRDRIYGLLGMLHGPGSDIGILPDYRPANTAARVFKEATALWTAQNDSFDLLYAAGAGWPDTTTPDLPSWVPDYTQTLQQYPGAHCRAGKAVIVTGLEALRFEGDVLHVQAIAVDKITSVMRYDNVPGSEKFIPIDEDPKVARYLDQAVNFATQVHSVPWTEAIAEDFVRTITHNSVVNSAVDGGSSAPSEYIDVFVQLDAAKELKLSELPHGQTRELPTALQKQRFLTTVAGYMEDHTICATKKKMFCLAPALVRVGDTVMGRQNEPAAQLEPVSVPFVL
ncbi:hypothetical protein N0V82_008466 [Gnomoniopsis sp. IMI 355080]|nr:hypothetical protein N0V82_008466 [Gnomoniopsis sp. IMI 355080]